MRLYTVQHLDIVERLRSGEAHVQPWENSAAFTGVPTDPNGVLFRTAYTFLAKEFEFRMGMPIGGAPIFTFMDRDKTAKTLDKSGPAAILTLDVPDTEILMTDYDFWAWTVLFNECGLHGLLSDCDDACREDSWREKLFRTPEDILKRQPILSRIEPGWVTEFE